MYRTLSPGAIDVSVRFEEGARLAARYGFEGLALDAGHLLGEGVDAVRETLAAYGLKPGSFGLPVDLRGDDDAYEASLGRLASVAEAAQQVGCTRAPMVRVRHQGLYLLLMNTNAHRQPSSKDDGCLWSCRPCSFSAWMSLW